MDENLNLHWSGPKYCSNEEAQRWMPTLISFGLGLMVFIMQKLAVRVIKARRLCLSTGRNRLLDILQVLTPLAVSVEMISFFVDMIYEFPSLVICRSPLIVELSTYAVNNWVRLVALTYMTGRTLVIWVLVGHTEAIPTVSNVVLMAQVVIGVVIKQEFIAFHFLLFTNVFCYEFNALFIKIGNRFGRITQMIKLWAWFFIIGGILRATEEWNTNFGYHIGFRGLYAPAKSSWSYIYWTVITVSTVGYGDVTPSTDIGRAVVMLVIIFSMAWFGSQCKTLKSYFDNKKTITIQENRPNHPLHHLVIGCDTVDHLSAFLSAFVEDDRRKVLVFMQEEISGLIKIANLFGVRVVFGNDPLKVIKDSHIFEGGQESFLWILYNAVSHNNAPVIDNQTVHLVKRIKDSNCVSRLFVKVTGTKGKADISQIKGWRGGEGIDVCIVSQLLDAHMLTHAAHARIRAALLAKASMTMSLELAENEEYRKATFSQIVEEQYYENKAIMLGSNSIAKDVLFAEVIEHVGKRLVLKSNEAKGWTKNTHNCLKITTTPIGFTAASPVKKNVCLTAALAQHPFPALGGPQEKIKIFSCNVQEDPSNTYDLLKARKDLGDETVISTLEHLYEICLIDDCVCGTFENNLSDIFLVKAYRDSTLYNLWTTLVEGEYFVVEEIQTNCHYCCLFDTMVKKRQIPLGVEINHKVDDKTTKRLPVLNPPPTYEVAKGSFVLSLRSNEKV
ncbi:uncharacterized protein LOC135197807 [Macrobrachium nipponense]|uniref:uncharacterized protein LOC135197807 n=1 Tax=Macrobrachium nipponense TaxID=159736 RepID=UPI0030C811A1